MQRSSIFAVIALGALTAVTPACGSSDDAPAESTGEARVALRGAYVPATANSQAAISLLSIESDTRYRLTASGCGAANCVEHGAFTYDKERRSLSLVVDGSGKAYSISLDILASRQATPADLSPSSLKPRTTPAEGDTNDGATLVNGPADLVQKTVSLVATEVTLNGETYSASNGCSQAFIRAAQEDCRTITCPRASRNGKDTSSGVHSCTARSNGTNVYVCACGEGPVTQEGDAF
jgi:hypothetical protein